jgi:hypothetical protein
MSYKYHERAIVINERNLIRVFDVCFDGYCGGNDARILRWTSDDTEQFRRQTQNVTAPYTGPSMVVMALPRHKNVFESFPNPLVWHPFLTNPSRFKAHPDKGGTPPNMQQHCPFAQYAGNELTHQVYSMYYGALGLDHWEALTTQLDPGILAYANETDPYVFSFHGHMAAILDGQREETQGSGHLGPNFVGVASVREGRGMLPRGMPTQHVFHEHPVALGALPQHCVGHLVVQLFLQHRVERGHVSAVYYSLIKNARVCTARCLHSVR